MCAFDPGPSFSELRLIEPTVLARWALVEGLERWSWEFATPEKVPLHWGSEEEFPAALRARMR